MNEQKESPELVNQVSPVSEVNSNATESSNSNSNAAELFEDLQKFYKGRANKNVNKSKLFEYDDDGDLIIKNKNDEIVKNISLPTYRPATESEIQDDYKQYLDKLKEASEEFEEARRELYIAYQTDADEEDILELNKNVQEADQRLLEVRFGNYDVDIIDALDTNIPSDKRITMRQLYFEKAILDKNVYDNVVFVNTRISNISNQVRIGEEAESVVSISEARKKGKKAGKFNKLMAKLKKSLNREAKYVIPTATEVHLVPDKPIIQADIADEKDKKDVTETPYKDIIKKYKGISRNKRKPLPSKQSISDVEQIPFSSGPVSDIKIAVNTALPELTSNKPLPEPSATAKSALNQFTSLFAGTAPAPAPAASASASAPVATAKSPFNQIKSALGIATNATNATEIKKKV